jgi:hypothetical protein
VSYTLIERKELAEAASILSFENIPQTYDDLVIKVSARCTRSDFALGSLNVQLNSVSSGYSNIWLRRNETGDTPSASGNTGGSSFVNLYTVPGPTITANTFSNIDFYIPNYRSNNPKSASSDGVGENNSSQNSSMVLMSHLSGVTQPVTSMQLSTSNDFVAGSTFSLYGINRQQAIGKPKAIGGAITFANGYWVHTFNASGTFYALENLTVDGIVVAGGGGGGLNGRDGGGGAGGALIYSSIIPSASSHSVVIGSGGGPAIQGNQSLFQSFIASGGGAAGSRNTSSFNGGVGGSGGGASIRDNVNGGPNTGTGGSGVSNQGFSGGNANTVSNNGWEAGGGGGGAGSAGSAGTGGTGTVAKTGGAGGIGIIWNGSYYAGGGGGGGFNGSETFASGGLGGGGTNSNGSLNTGGGGSSGAKSGGSGVVIIRYPAN